MHSQNVNCCHQCDRMVHAVSVVYIFLSYYELSLTCASYRKCRKLQRRKQKSTVALQLTYIFLFKV